MNVIEKYLTMNPYTRPVRKLSACKGIVFHYVGIPNQRALTTWNYFERDCPRDKHYSSAHYIIDLNGDVIHCVPDDEVAYHCGSSIADPASGRIYTDWAREKFGYFASNPISASPNLCTIGIEMCVDGNGEFTFETLNAAVELAVKLLDENHLHVNDIGHHNLVVGWKDCPLSWVKKPELFDEFKERVKNTMGLLI